MTIQLAIANSYGIAMASDRHVFRDGSGRSTGQEQKLVRLRTATPAAMMAAGPLAVLNVPVSRIALQVENAIRSVEAVGTPEALAEAVLHALAHPVRREPAGQPIVAGSTSLPAISKTPLPRVPSRHHDTGSARSAMRADGGQLALPDEPAGRRSASDLYVTVGLCCPATGVPVLVSLRLWRGGGDRLLFASRLVGEYEAVWKSTRTVVVAQGTGRATIEAMVDGMAAEHWDGLSAGSRTRSGPAMSARWDRAHDRIAVSSLRELGAIATGLVRGAEVIGYLTREGEGTVAAVDCLVLTPGGVIECGLPAGAEAAGQHQYERGIPSTCCPT